MKTAITRRLLAPLLRTRTFFASRGTIFATTIGSGPSGNVTYVKGDALYSDIPCRVAPSILIRPTDTQVSNPDYVRTVRSRNAVLSEYLPAITPNMIFTSDDTDYNITGVDFDGNHVMTRLHLEDRNPNVNPI